ncbi:MAG: PAS domain-containing protein, partial [Proteobacteria bacterium]|nr:PAS domain-containing protein [Pseudomonadota bacterium]
STDAPPEQLLADVLEALDVSVCIADARLDDQPLVWANAAFERTTGYPFEQVVGRNCRFLQGPATDPAHVARIRAALQAQEHLTITLLNYRKDGTAFWNELSLSPVYDAHGALTHYVGIQADVTARVQIEQEVARAREQLRKEVASLAVVGAGQVLGREIDAKAHADLLDKVANEL